MQRAVSRVCKRLVQVSFNGTSIDVPAGTNVYEASKKVLTKKEMIPVICYHEDLSSVGTCGICKVEMVTPEGNVMIPSCKTVVEEGAEYITDSAEVNDNIKSTLKFMLSAHPLECGKCDVSGACTFQDMLGKYKVGVKDLDETMTEKYKAYAELNHDEKIFGNNAITIDRSKCIKCTRCIRSCSEIQGMNILGMRVTQDGTKEVYVVGSDDDTFESFNCLSCGQCSVVCPTRAISFKSEINEVVEYLDKSKDEKYVVVASIAPAVRVTISEALGMGPGEIPEEQLCAALRQCGFDYVFDTNFTADLTIVEEATELIERITSGSENFPMFTSCCPAWITLVEKQYPEFIPNLSSCKSPQGMMGALIKNYWPEKVGIHNPKRVISVSIMPCTAKKNESKRPQLEGDHDFVLTVRELANLLKIKKLSKKKILKLEPTPFDHPLGESTGAAVIFGKSGGVMEAALRTASDVLTGEELGPIEFTPLPDHIGISEASVNFAGLELNVAVSHSIGYTKKLLEMIKSGEKTYDFIEVMSCATGCIGGGGNPKPKGGSGQAAKLRRESITQMGDDNVMQMSHKNPAIIELYEEFFGEAGSHLAHDLLHTHYEARTGLYQQE